MGSRSTNAKNVAKDVLEKISKHELVNMYEIQRDNGYSHYSSRAMVATKTDEYKTVMFEYGETMAMKLKDINVKAAHMLEEKLNLLIQGKEKWTIRDGAYLMDLLSKNINLLEGQVTERIEHRHEIITEDDAEEYLKQIL